MKALLSLALLALSSTFSIAQDSSVGKCPTVTVTGPTGIVNVGELASYTATVSNAEQYAIEYVWSVSAGRIKDGQGTGSIRVIQPDAGLTATVEVKGLPEGCPSSASETAIGDPAPEPIQFYELEQNAFFTARSVAAEMLENPNNQLYILAGDVGRKNSPAFRKKQQSIIGLLSEFGVTRDRITIETVYSDVELFQFWRVPPGASNPKCDECDEAEHALKECPSVSITGPAGVTGPGEAMTFVATVTGTLPKEARYIWSITSADIVDGQGTERITARYKPRGYELATATLTISGLPEQCPRSFSETLAMTIDPGPEKLGSITNSTYTIGKEFLVKIASSLREEPSSQLYVWVYLGSDEAKFPRLKAHLLGQLSRTKIDPSRFTIMGTSEPGRGAAFWRIRPGVSNPAP